MITKVMMLENMRFLQKRSKPLILKKSNTKIFNSMMKKNGIKIIIKNKTTKFFSNSIMMKKI
jgi:hypothetical protein